MTVFIRALDGSLLRLGAVSRIRIASGFVPVEAGGDGSTVQEMIYADQYGLGVAAPGGNTRKLMETLVIAASECTTGGIFTIQHGDVIRL